MKSAVSTEAVHSRIEASSSCQHHGSMHAQDMRSTDVCCSANTPQVRMQQSRWRPMNAMSVEPRLSQQCWQHDGVQDTYQSCLLACMDTVHCLPKHGAMFMGAVIFAGQLSNGCTPRVGLHHVVAGPEHKQMPNGGHGTILHCGRPLYACSQRNRRGVPCLGTSPGHMVRPLWFGAHLTGCDLAACNQAMSQQSS